MERQFEIYDRNEDWIVDKSNGIYISRKHLFESERTKDLASKTDGIIVVEGQIRFEYPEAITGFLKQLGPVQNIPDSYRSRVPTLFEYIDATKWAKDNDPVFTESTSFLDVLTRNANDTNYGVNFDIYYECLDDVFDTIPDLTGGIATLFREVKFQN